MKISDIGLMPLYFDRYINQVDPNLTLNEALDIYGAAYILKDFDKMKALGDKTYAPEKWTMKDIVQHIIDTERIFSYRALRFARKDQTLLPGFDENEFAKNTNANHRTLEDLLDEFAAVRQSTKALFASFDDKMLHLNGVAFKSDISVLAVGFTLIGHVIHHQKVVNDLYFPMLGQ